MLLPPGEDVVDAGVDRTVEDDALGAVLTVVQDQDDRAREHALLDLR